MPETSTPKLTDEQLAVALVQAYVAGGMVKPVLPEGMRQPVIDLLYGLFADSDRLARYLEFLRAEQDRHGATDRILHSPTFDIDDERIAQDGFDDLSDEVLAAIASYPYVASSFEEYLDDPESRPGKWYVENVIAVEAARPDAQEFLDACKPVVDRLRENGFLSLETPRVAPFTHHPVFRWATRVTAIAASLLLGAFLGRSLLQSGGVSPPALLATVALSFEGGRGGSEAIPKATVESNAPGFISIVTLPLGGLDRPFVFPIAPDDDIAVGPETGPVSILFPEDMRDAQIALLVVTPTPAADTLDKALFEASFSASQIDGLETLVRETLRAKGYDRMAVTKVILDRPKP